MLNLSKIQAITLDLDDTLWPVWPTIARAEQVLQEWLSVHAPQTAQLCADADLKKSIRSEINQRHADKAHDLSFLRRESIRECLFRAGDAPHLAEPAFEVFFAERQNVTLYEGVQQALERLSMRYPLVGLSNGNADVFQTAAGPYFQASLSARLFGVAKPDVRIFHAAAAKLNLPVEAVLHIGDDATTDVLGARNAGMQTVWVNTQGHEWPYGSIQPLTVASLVELCDHLLP
ncbi:HAD family hydrolase [Limnohabitans sp. Jir61]|uniref:HAD family hydrolase n=1 Tax=Limnohabitans sp. Jir61 TaxID=1826168 RepID=UPI000D37E0AC|nr:HAD-IA family hydrolase [Limnohabitans sp. Jir61]PUE28838.1 HAD family hydrolase [Limnohabitans sp. Jir61]